MNNIFKVNMLPKDIDVILTDSDESIEYMVNPDELNRGQSLVTYTNKYKTKLKGFNHPWHLAHQYELSKIPFIDWEYLIQYKRPYSEQARGNFMRKWVDHYQSGKYDFALLHLDQQCVVEGISTRGKGTLYNQLNEVIQDIPKIVIMHGTPYYPEMMSEDEIIEKVKNIVGDNTMVTNSYRASEQFGWGTPIWHGMDKDEWFDLPKENRVVTMISPGGLDKYYDRTFFEAIRDELLERGIYHCHITVDWVAKNWDEYRDFLGRSLLYLNPTKESPMPRSRTEAMLSGCCVLTTPWQDADKFIKDGKNGFIIPRNPIKVADMIEDLITTGYDRAIRIGQEGKKTAIKEFNLDRYFEDWRQLLQKVTGKEI